MATLATSHFGTLRSNTSSSLSTFPYLSSNYLTQIELEDHLSYYHCLPLLNFHILQAKGLTHILIANRVKYSPCHCLIQAHHFKNSRYLPNTSSICGTLLSPPTPCWCGILTHQPLSCPSYTPFFPWSTLSRHQTYASVPPYYPSAPHGVESQWTLEWILLHPIRIKSSHIWGIYHKCS